MKAEKENHIPLSREAMSLLKSIQEYTQSQNFISVKGPVNKYPYNVVKIHSSTLLYKF